MKPSSRFALINEMLETADIIQNFRPELAQDWANKIKASKHLFITGEGSSRIFPAKNLLDHALKQRIDWSILTHGARQAADYDLSAYTLLAASNSGRTREVVDLYNAMPDACRLAVTAGHNSPLEQAADDTRILDCGAEQAVAATKSVVEQALVYQSLLQGAEWENQDLAAQAARSVMAQDMDRAIVDDLANATYVYFAGREDGVAEELTLKTNEIIRKKSSFLEGTYVLHGIEEVMQNHEIVILIDPFDAEIDAYQRILVDGANIKVIAISAEDTPFPTIKIPQVSGFNNYLQLLAGWNLLATTGLALDIDIDRPMRARKVGNEV